MFFFLVALQQMRPRRLCTHPGKYGDILWSLPTVALLAKEDGHPVDFATRPPYRSLVPLLRSLIYIDNVIIIENWSSTGSPFGDQPWECPFEFPGRDQYQLVTHLGYRSRPVGMGCARFMAAQLGKVLPPSGIYPFLLLQNPSFSVSSPSDTFVVSGVGGILIPEQNRFWDQVLQGKSLRRIALDSLPWMEAMQLVRHPNCLCFLGSRSSLRVLALGVDQTTIIYEPHAGRNHLLHRPGLGAKEIRIDTPAQASHVIQRLQQGFRLPKATIGSDILKIHEYRRLYPDVKHLKTDAQVQDHWKRHGEREGRLPCVDTPLYRFLYLSPNDVRSEAEIVEEAIHLRNTRLCGRR